MLPQRIDGVKLQDYVCGGYYIPRLRKAGTERPLSAMLPRRYFSPSGCLCDLFPGSWVWNYAGPMTRNGEFVEGISRFEEQLAGAARFGITAELLPNVIRWGQMRAGRDFGFPTGFYRLVEARRGADWITLPAEAFVIIGIGLHRSLATRFLQDTVENRDCTVPICVREGQNSAGKDPRWVTSC
jgi:hypothetical protein